MAEPQPLHVCMIGDHAAGKSTIAGLILVGTGGLGERYFNRIKNEFAERNLEGTPFNYAAIMDRKGDNRYKLSTIVSNHAVILAGRCKLYFFDTPGHQRYWHRSINFMSLADVCVFVVDSTKDIESSRFHNIATFAKHFGVQQLVVAISRMDSHLNPMERYNLLKDSVLQGLLKAGVEEGSILGVVPTTSVNDGANIMSNKRYFDWYTGEAVYELLELAKPRERNSNARGLGVVDESMRIGGIGTVTTVSMLQGKGKFNQAALLYPLGKYRRCLSIEQHHMSMQEAVAGQWVGINLRHTTPHEAANQFLVFPNDGETAIEDFLSIPSIADSFTVDAIIRSPNADILRSEFFKSVKIMSRMAYTTGIVLNIDRMDGAGDDMALREGDKVRIVLQCLSRIAVAEESRIPELSKLMILSDSGSDAILASATVVSVVEPKLTEISVAVPLEIDGPRRKSSGLSAIKCGFALLRNNTLLAPLSSQTLHIVQLRNPWELDAVTFAACKKFVQLGGTLIVVHTRDPAAAGAPDRLCDHFGIEWSTTNEDAPSQNGWDVPTCQSGPSSYKPISHLPKLMLQYQHAKDLISYDWKAPKSTNTHIQASDHDGQWFPDEIWQQILRNATDCDASAPFKFLLVSKYLHTVSNRLNLHGAIFERIPAVPSFAFAVKSEEDAKRWLSYAEQKGSEMRLKQCFSRYLDGLGASGGIIIDGPAGHAKALRQHRDVNTRIRVNDPKLFHQQGGRVICQNRAGDVYAVHFPRLWGSDPMRSGQVFFFSAVSSIPDSMWHNMILDAAVFTPTSTLDLEP